MDLTDAELSLLVNNLLDHAHDLIRHGTDCFDQEDKDAVSTLSAKAGAEALRRRTAGNSAFWWAK